MIGRARWAVVADDVAGVLPGLQVRHVTVPVADHRTPADVRARLDYLAERIDGARAIELRRQEIPFAYRVFFRKIGLDPDVCRTPIERLVLDRLVAGGFAPRGLVADAVTIATAETGVAVVAFDGAAVGDELFVRSARGGERLRTADASLKLAAGTPLIASGERLLAVLFGAVDERVEVSERSTTVELAAIRVPGVPLLAVDEALWIAAETITGPGQV